MGPSGQATAFSRLGGGSKATNAAMQDLRSIRRKQTWKFAFGTDSHYCWPQAINSCPPLWECQMPCGIRSIIQRG